MSDSLTPSDGGLVRVLHVDDDPSILEVSKEVLMDMGKFEVEHACCVDEALRKLEEENFDVVVSDYEMPQKDGLEFLRRLREQKNDIPFILFTGKGREEVAIKALNLGADGYINKHGSPETVYGELAHDIVLVSEKKKNRKTILENEQRYRSLFLNMKNGFAYCRMIYNDKRQPIDFVYLEVNEAFEKLTGLKRSHVLNKKVSEAIPGSIEAHSELLKIYGEVALTGISTSFELYFKPLNIWLSIFVYSTRRDYFIAVFDNISREKRAQLIVSSRANILEFAVNHGSEELLHKVLDEAECLTGSCIGFFHFFDSDQKSIKLMDWSTRTEREFCSAQGKGSHYSLDKAGVWADSVRERKTIICNE